MQDNNNRGKATAMGGLLMLTAFAALVTATAFAAPANAHSCTGTIGYIDCGTCTAGDHNHNALIGGCSSSCPSPPANCDPGKPPVTKLTANIARSVDVSISRDFASPCGGNEAADGIDGRWFAVSGQDGRAYSSSSSEGLRSTPTFYSASCVPLTVFMPGRVPSGVRYIHLNADSGQGTATFMSFP